MALGTPVAAAAAYSASGGTTVAPAYPAGILATDVVLLFVGQKPTTTTGGTVTTPTNWTLREELTGAGGYTAQGADTGNTNIRIYSWNSVVAGQTGTLTVTIGGNDVTWAFMVRIPKGAGAAEFGSADGQRTTTPTSPMSIALTNGASATNFQTGDRAIWAMVIPTDVTTPSQFSAQSITATGATFGAATELNEPDSGTGNDIGGYSAWAAVTAGSSTTAPTVTVTLAGTLTNVRGPVGLIRIREGAAPQTLTPARYNNTNTFHNPTVTAGTVTLTPALYTNTQTFYGPDVTQAGGTQNLDPALYTNTNTFYAATVSAINSLTPARYDNTNTFYAATVTTSVTLTPARYDNGQTFFAATVASQYELTAARYDNQQAFYSPTVASTYSLTPVRYDNTQAFYGPTVASSITLDPNRYDNTQSFYSAVITQTGGPRTLLPDLYTNTQTFYSATVEPGTVTLSPSRYDNSQQFYSASIGAANELLPSRLDNQQDFYAATVTGLDVLVPARFDNSQSFYSPTVDENNDLQPQRLDNVQQFYAPTVEATNAIDVPRVDSVNVFYSATVVQGQNLVPQPYVVDGYFTPSGYSSPNTYSVQVFYSPSISAAYTLTPARYDNTQTFYAPTVADQDVLAPSLYVNTNTFYGPTVTPGPVDLQPSLYVNTNQFFSAAVELGTYTITTAQARLLQQIYKLNGLDSSPLSVNTKFRTVDNIFQTISEDRSGTVTVETVSSQTFATDDPGQMIEDLAALYALTDTLQVTRNGRSVGTLSQSIETSGFTTTVTRLT